MKNIHFWKPNPPTDSLGGHEGLLFPAGGQECPELKVPTTNLLGQTYSHFSISFLFSKLLYFSIILAQYIAKLVEALIVMTRGETFFLFSKPFCDFCCCFTFFFHFLFVNF